MVLNVITAFELGFHTDQEFAKCLSDYWRTLVVNVLCSFLLVIYATFGAIIFLYFEVPFSHHLKLHELQNNAECISSSIRHLLNDKAVRIHDNFDDLNLTYSVANRRKRVANTENEVLTMAREITSRCVIDAQKLDERSVWNLKNAFLFSFGIMTTLGYGKIEPQTENGRIFTVIYGFVGVPFTVILLTNFMRYLLNLERHIRKRYYIRQHNKLRTKEENDEAERQFRSVNIAGQVDSATAKTESHLKLSNNSRISPLKKNYFKDEKLYTKSIRKFGRKTDLAAIVASLEEFGQISMCTLICIVFIYMLCGGVLMWVVASPSTIINTDSSARFLSGIYYSFIALIHIEYGNLVPASSWWLPLVMSYVCLGLSISAIALRVGSAYVKRLYYYGRKIGNITSVKIRFGAKNLQVRELLTALGHNIGLEPTILFDLDLEKLIANAIDVKEGRMERVPQTYMIVDGIWPPELVPLFIKDGGDFPLYVDAEEAQITERRGLSNLWSSFRNSLRTRTEPTTNSGAARRRHSSVSLLPLSDGITRQKRACIRPDANNNDQELHPHSRSVQKMRHSQFGIRPLTGTYISNTEIKNSTRSPTLSSLPSSRAQSPCQERRAPPPFLFHKPSVRFHDIIYNDWTKNVENTQPSKLMHIRYNHPAHYYSDSSNDQRPKLKRLQNISTVVVNPMTLRSEVVRVIEKESYDVQLLIPSAISSELFDEHSSFFNNRPSTCGNKTVDSERNISSNPNKHYMEAKSSFTETYVNRNLVQSECISEKLTHPIPYSPITTADTDATTRKIDIKINRI